MKSGEEDKNRNLCPPVFQEKQTGKERSPTRGVCCFRKERAVQQVPAGPGAELYSGFCSEAHPLGSQDHDPVCPAAFTQQKS